MERLEQRELLAVFMVNAVSDNAPLSNGQGAGNTGDLRYAILQATLNPGPDVIQFSLPGNSTISPNPGAAANIGPTAFTISDFGVSTINNDITLDGSTSPGLTIDGGHSTRLFNLGGAASTVTLRLKNLTVANGLAAGGDGGDGGVGGGGGAGLGGAIFVQSSGQLVTEGVTFVNNVARGGTGGDGRNDTLTGSGPINASIPLHGAGGGGGMGASGQDGSISPSPLRGGNGGGTQGGQGGNIANNQLGAPTNGGLGSGGGGAGYDIFTSPISGITSATSKDGGNAGFGGGGGGGTTNGGTSQFAGGRGGSASIQNRLDLFGGQG